MSADFWAGYLSGAFGIIIGNPLDVIKVRLQANSGLAAAQATVRNNSIPYTRQFQNTSSLVTGTAAPILGYGALNALLFMSYNRTESALNDAFSVRHSLWSTWTAGAVGGLATWVVSAPTELIKCRAQLSTTPTSSWAITKQIWRNEGIRGLYFGGLVTSIRDSVGYGFYFWSYEIFTRSIATSPGEETAPYHEAAKVLLCGGLAGVVTWTSVFPLDVVKTRLQAQDWPPWQQASMAFRGSEDSGARRLGALRIAQETYKQGGLRAFFRGLTVCNVRAFIVNAAQWAVYEWVMHHLGERKQRPVLAEIAGGE